jgi:hypothetical protein
MAGYLYNRTKQCFKVIKKRTPEPTEDYGITSECCEPVLVLAHLSDTETWKNDKTSAWEKCDFSTDIVNFKLYDENDVLTSYQPTLTPFVANTTSNQLDFYATIDWQQVLQIDGVGCYRFMVEYTFDGVSGSYEWGHYNLLPYTPENARNSVRIRSVFNQYHRIEDIDFTGSIVEDTIRFNGFFGSRQTNMVVDNLIYQGRIEKNVQRENLNTYELKTDPLKEWYIKKLVDLHLLSETEIYLSDHNEFNLTYSYKDKPLIVKEAPELDHKEYSRLSSLTCVFSDKVKDQLSRYNG